MRVEEKDGLRVMADKETKQALFAQFARVGQALSNGRRGEMVDVLANGERAVESIAIEVGLSVANASQHLQVLRRAGLVTGRREGTSIYYSLSDRDVLLFWRQLQDLAKKQLAEVDRLAEDYLGTDGVDETMTADELARKLQQRSRPYVLDVRPRQEYVEGHIPGAVSIPLEELHSRVKKVPKDRDVVVYCRGQFCAYAPEAVKFLRKKGFRAIRLAEGLPDWQAAGRPIESGASE